MNYISLKDIVFASRIKNSFIREAVKSLVSELLKNKKYYSESEVISDVLSFINNNGISISTNSFTDIDHLALSKEECSSICDEIRYISASEKPKLQIYFEKNPGAVAYIEQSGTGAILVECSSYVELLENAQYYKEMDQIANYFTDIPDRQEEEPFLYELSFSPEIPMNDFIKMTSDQMVSYIQL